MTPFKSTIAIPSLAETDIDFVKLLPILIVEILLFFFSLENIEIIPINIDIKISIENIINFLSFFSSFAVFCLIELFSSLVSFSSSSNWNGI